MNRHDEPASIEDMRRTLATDPGEAYTRALVEYIERGGRPGDVLAACPVCQQTNEAPGHRTPLGHPCAFGDRSLILGRS